MAGSVEVRIRYLMSFSQEAGVREETLSLDAKRATVRDMLRLIGRRHGPLLEKRIAEGGTVLVDGQPATPDTTLASGSLVTVSHLVGGG